MHYVWIRAFIKYVMHYTTQKTRVPHQTQSTDGKRAELTYGFYAKRDRRSQKTQRTMAAAHKIDRLARNWEGADVAATLGFDIVFNTDLSGSFIGVRSSDGGGRKLPEGLYGSRAKHVGIVSERCW